MAFDVMVPFRRALQQVSADNGVRVVVVTGSGTSFCAGADLQDPGGIPGIEGLTLPTVALRSMELLDDVIDTVRRMHQPVVAAVNGPAIGGGFCLALAADLRLAAPTAVFRAAGISNGLTAAELGISYLLPRVVGAGRAADIMLSGRDVGAEEAERIGLVSAVCDADDLLPRSWDLADRIIGYSRPGWSSPSACSGPAWTPRASPPTWTTRASASSSSASPPATSRRPWWPAGSAAPRCSRTDGVRPPPGRPGPPRRVPGLPPVPAGDGVWP